MARSSFLGSLRSRLAILGSAALMTSSCALDAVRGPARAAGAPLAPAPAGPPAAPPAAFSTQPTAARVVITHLSDSEAGLLPREEGQAGGFARATAIIDALRARAGPDGIMVSAGDLFIPSPELSLELDGASAVLTRNTQLALDASVLGNHELDLGEQFLADAIARMPFPYLSATIRVAAGPLLKVVTPVEHVTPWADEIAGKLAPRTRLCAGTLSPRGEAPSVRRCDGTTIGLIGATTEELRLISAGASASLVMPVDLDGVRLAIQEQVDALAREGISVVVLLSHLQSAARELALIERGLQGVDVIVSGGGEHRLAAPHHRLLAGHAADPLCHVEGGGARCYPIVRTAADGRPVLIVATGGDLEYIGQLAVTFDADGALTGYDPARSRPWPVDDDSVQELRAPASAASAAFERRVHEALVPLLEEIAPSRVFLDGEREAVRNRETNLGDLSADAILHAATRDTARAQGPAPVIALRNGGGIRASVGTIDVRTGGRAPTPIRVLDLKTSLRFDSPIVVVHTTHAGLKRTLESALRGAGTARGHFPQVSANVLLRYSTDAPEQTHELRDGRVAGIACPGARVRDLVLRVAPGEDVTVVRDGALLTPDAPVAIATLEYLARGGDGWFPTESVAPTPLTGVSEQSSLRAFLVEEQRAGRWRDGAGYALEALQRIVRVDAAAAAIPPGCGAER